MASRRPGSDRDEDLGKVYYNRACYEVLLGRYSSALDDLKAAFHLDRGLTTIAGQDQDLIAVREQLRGIFPTEPVV